MKRVMSVILAAMLFAALCAVPGLADGLTVEVSSGEAAPGETVTLTFTLTGNPGIAAYSADVIYDQNALELVSLSSGKEISGLTFISYVPTKRAAAFSTSNTSGDGVLFKAKFRVQADAAEGFAPVTVSFSEMADVSYTDYSPGIVSGGVTVLPAAEGGGEPADEEPVSDQVVIEPDESMDFGDELDDIAADIVVDTGGSAGTGTGGGSAGSNNSANNTNTGNNTAAGGGEPEESAAPEAEPAGIQLPTPETKAAAEGGEPAGEPEAAPAAGGEDGAQAPDGDEGGSGAAVAIAAAAAAVVAAAVVVYIFIIRKKKTKPEPETGTDKTGVE